jgi:hypothetical protein
MFQIPGWLADRNVASWRALVGFYDELVAYTGWEFAEPLQRLARAVADSEWARWFRAGQSLHTMMVSTAAVHGLRDGDPFVSVDVRREVDSHHVLCLTYHSGVWDVTHETRTCDEASGLAELTYLLTRLGNDPNGRAARQRS